MKRVLGKNLKVGDTAHYADEPIWTVVEAPAEREGHTDGYGISLSVEKPNGTNMRISIGRDEPFQVQ